MTSNFIYYSTQFQKFKIAIVLSIFFILFCTKNSFANENNNKSKEVNFQTGKKNNLNSEKNSTRLATKNSGNKINRNKRFNTYGVRNKKKKQKLHRPKDWMLFGVFWDHRSNTLNLNNSVKQKLKSSYYSGSLEWAAMAENEDMFSEFHFIPGFTGLLSGYIDDYKNYPTGENKKSNLSIFSFGDFFTSYQLLRSNWGGLSPGFWIAHKGVYFDTGISNKEREKLYFSNFFSGPILEYSYSPFMLFHIRLSYVIAIAPIYERNNSKALYQQGKFEIYFPMDVKYGWLKMQNQFFMIKASIRYSRISTEEKRFAITLSEWKKEIGFCWLY